MPDPYPALKALHPETSLSPAKLDQLQRLSSDALMNSLVPGQRDCLKTRRDGTIIDGHHRIHVLRAARSGCRHAPAGDHREERVVTMGTELHWVDGPWPGRLAIAARPRGGDWLEDEMAHWHHSGVDTVLSLLSPDEEHTLGLDNEADTVRAQVWISSRFHPGSPGTGLGDRVGGGFGESGRQAFRGQECVGSLPAGSRPSRVG